MAKKKNVKRTLAASLISMALCGAMLVGSTYAWFTDTASSGNNTITAGNLDVELEYSHDYATEGSATWTNAHTSNADHNLFHLVDGDADGFLWEPGVMLVSDPFRVKNEGDLALQYTLALKTINEVKGPDGQSLADVISAKIVDANTEQAKAFLTNEDTPGAAFDRADAWEKLDAEAKKISEINEYGIILPANADEELPGATTEYSKEKFIVLYWAPGDNDTDNKYNMKNDDLGEGQEPIALSIEFGLNIFATQVPYEEDSFGDQYDKDALISDLPKPTNGISTFDLTGQSGIAISVNTTDATLSLKGERDKSVSVDLSNTNVTMHPTVVDGKLQYGKDIALQIANDTTVTLSDGEFHAPGGLSLMAMPGTNVTILSGTYEGQIAAYTTQAGTQCTITINGGNFIDVCFNAYDKNTNKPTIIIEGNAEDFDFTNCRIQVGDYDSNGNGFVKFNVSGWKVDTDHPYENDDVMLYRIVRDLEG